MRVCVCVCVCVSVCMRAEPKTGRICVEVPHQPIPEGRYSDQGIPKTLASSAHPFPTRGHPASPSPTSSPASLSCPPRPSWPPPVRSASWRCAAWGPRSGWSGGRAAATAVQRGRSRGFGGSWRLCWRLREGRDRAPQKGKEAGALKRNRAQNAHFFAVGKIPAKIPPVAQLGQPSIPGP